MKPINVLASSIIDGSSLKSLTKLENVQSVSPSGLILYNTNESASRLVLVSVVQRVYSYLSVEAGSR
jgi:hypothetical protein